MVIGITASDSPLAQQSRRILAVETPENTDFHAPMTSRHNQLVLIDILATAVALKRVPEFADRLIRIKYLLWDT